MSMTAALLLMAGAAAAERPADPLLETCLAGPDDSNLGISQCWSAAIERANARVDELYATALAAVGGRDSAAGGALSTEQAAWVQFRDASCQLWWGPDFGSLHRSIIGPSCRYDIVVERIGQLQRIVEETAPEGQ